MSKNLKTLICCVLALVFVAGTVIAVFADSTRTFTKEAESVSEIESEVEESTVVDETTTETTTEDASDETTTETPAETTTEAESEVESTEYAGKLGDVDKNGKIEAVDARLALRFAAQLQAYNEYEGWAADVITDGKLVAEDARIILRVAANLEYESYLGSAKALEDYSVLVTPETTTAVLPDVSEEDSSVA